MFLIECGCDIGGSVNSICDKTTGNCECQPRISGRTCNEPLKTHYFPTLHQYLYEAEDGRTPAQTPVRIGFNDTQFPNYSWKGYAIFSMLQVNLVGITISINQILFQLLSSANSAYNSFIETS